MRKKLLATALIAPFLMGGVVAAAEPVEQVPCEEDAKYPVVGAGETFTFESTGDDSVMFYLDPTTSDKGRVSTTVTLTWDIPVNDYDLEVNGETSIGLQPVDGPTEQVSVSAAGRCKLVTASWGAFLVATADSLVLTAAVR